MRDIGRTPSPSQLPLQSTAAGGRGEPSAGPRPGRGGEPSGVLGGLAALRRGPTSAAGGARAAASTGGIGTVSILNRRNDQGDTPLTLAITAGRVDAVESLLAHAEVNVNLANSRSETPLHLAVLHGKVEIVKLLMRHPGIAPGLPNLKGDTPLHLAAARNDPALARALLDGAEPSVNQTNATGQSALAIALHGGHHQVAAELLKQPDTDVNVKNGKGESLLYQATALGDAESVKLLLRDRRAQATEGTPAGQDPVPCDVNLANPRMETPLHRAALQGNAEIVTLLMSHAGIAPGLPDKNGDIPLHLAAARNDPALIRALLDCPAEVVNQPNAKGGQTALAVALDGRNHQAAAELLKHPGIDVNAMNSKGESLLYQATARGDTESVKLLINDRRVRATEKTSKGIDPMQLAMAREDVAVVRLLATDPALANAFDAGGRAPLDRAVEMDSHRVISALLESDAVDANQRNDVNQTPLSRATYRIEWMAGHDHDHYLKPRFKTLTLLVESNKVDPNAQFHNGETLLTRLCKMEPTRDVAESPTGKYFYPAVRGALASVLAVSGGHLDVNQRNRTGETALQVCARAGDIGLSSLLLGDKRTDPNVLAQWLISNPGHAYRHLLPYHGSPSQDQLDRFVERTLTQWADQRRADGNRHPQAYLSSACMGRWLAAREQAAAFGGRVPAPCSKDAMHHLTLALERAMDFAESLQRDLLPVEQRNLKDVARWLLNHAPADARHFNLKGVDVSRAEVEIWATGRLPDALVNRQIERGIRTHLRREPDVHIPGLTARGSRILTELRNRVPERDRLSVKQCVEGIKAAMKTLYEEGSTRERVQKGLDFALQQNRPVGEGLGTNVSEVLSAMWSYIQTFASPPATAAQAPLDAPEASSSEAAPALDEEIQETGETEAQAAQRLEMHGNRLAALLGRLGDIADDPNCNTGCVQRILYAVDGVDFSLTGAEPDQDAVAEEIKSLAAQVNERFGALYADSTSEPGPGAHAASTSAGSSLSAAERQWVARYQRGLPVDNDLVVKVKQDMLEAAVMADLVGRRGWGEQSVKAELEKIKEGMAYV